MNLEKKEMKIIIFDFEVFKHDVLLGAYVYDGITKEIFQSWDTEEIKNFYLKHQNDIWIGYNNERYDNHILEAVLKDKNPKKISDQIIQENKKMYLNIDLVYFDLFSRYNTSLKMTEAFFGKNIYTSEVEFNLDRPLTKEEKIETENYNKADIDQTFFNFKDSYNAFELRMLLAKDFNLPLESISYPISKISSKVLGAEKIHNIENMQITNKLPSTLQLQNQEIKDFYLSKKYLDSSLKIDVCSVSHKLGVGGIHGARKKYFAETNNDYTIWYFDVSGYYNLIMINYDLLPRCINKNGKKLYEKMYYEQLSLKKTNPKKRGVLKVILLAVFGSMLNKYTNFYDPETFYQVTLYGQLFLVDLLEKLEPYIELVQSNTDGIVVKCEKKYEDKVLEISREWQKRTKFVLKEIKVDSIIQRDVNCYMMKIGDEITTLGEAVKHAFAYESIYWSSSLTSKEPIIISRGIVEALINNVSPEEIVKKYQDKFEYFQFISRRGSYDWIELVEKNNQTGEEKIVKLGGINRCFASNDNNFTSTLYKRRNEGKSLKTKIAGHPENVFIVNSDISFDTNKKLIKEKIDYNYYVSRIYERIDEFL